MKDEFGLHNAVPYLIWRNFNISLTYAEFFIYTFTIIYVYPSVPYVSPDPCISLNQDSGSPIIEHYIIMALPY